MKAHDVALSRPREVFLSARRKLELGAIWYVIPALWITLALVASFWPA